MKCSPPSLYLYIAMPKDITFLVIVFGMPTQKDDLNKNAIW